MVAVSLGCHVDGAAQPHPDPQDPETMHAGIAKRFLCETPRIDPKVLASLREFVRKWLRSNLVPISPEEDLSVPTWLKQTNYPQFRREELLRVWEDTDEDVTRDPFRKHFKCKSFMKDETYPTWKHARGINSRSDAFKCAVGPIFKAIEHEVFKHPAFIKKVPIEQRPAYLKDLLYRGGATYFATDYTSFEGLFVAELMEAVEFELYDYMTSCHPCHDKFMFLCHNVLAGRNVCEYKYNTACVDATRMSGEMCTSLGNSFANLMIMLFICEEKGNSETKGAVEGDDGLFTTIGTPPTTGDFERLGLIIKLEVHQELSTASFCGIIFDENDLCNLTDPRKVLATFGWGSRKYAMAKASTLDSLLRCKALSFAHQYPGCPIVQSLARYGLRVTSSVISPNDARRINNMSDSWLRERYSRALENPVCFKPIGFGSRMLVERLFRIPIDHQLKIEAYLDSLSVRTPLRCPYIDWCMAREWRDYWAEYSVVPQDKRSRDLEYPSRTWPSTKEYDEW